MFGTVHFPIKSRSSFKEHSKILGGSPVYCKPVGFKFSPCRRALVLSFIGTNKLILHDSCITSFNNLDDTPSESSSLKSLNNLLKIHLIFKEAPDHTAHELQFKGFYIT